MDGSIVFALIGVLAAIYAFLDKYRREDLNLRTTKVDIFVSVTALLYMIAIVIQPILRELNLVFPWAWQLGFNEENSLFLLGLFLLGYWFKKLFDKKLPFSKIVIWKNAVSEKIRHGDIDQASLAIAKFQGQILANKAPDELKIAVKESLRYRRLVESLVQVDPIFLLKFIHKYGVDEDVLTWTFEYLILNEDSLLRIELKDTQNFSPGAGFFIDDKSAILDFLFNNLEVARTCEVYRPLGNTITSFIKRQKTDYYSEYDSEFSYGSIKWGCPIFNGILFFHIMVSKAILQDSQDHFWLMYLEYFTEEILSAKNPAISADPTSEFPSRFDYLIYEIVSTYCDWMNMIRELENECSLSQQKICYWVLVSCGTTFYHILESENIASSQKEYFVSMIVRILNDFDNGGLSPYAKLLVSSMLQGTGMKVDSYVLSVLANAYSEIDHVLRDSASTVAQIIDNPKLVVRIR